MRHLSLEPTRQRTLILLLGILAAALYYFAYEEPIWGFYLNAPQYPFGLTLSIFMSHVSGDVTEVNVLNHYIGMARLDEAAKLERAFSGLGLTLIASASLLAAVLPSRRSANWLALPALVFPPALVAVMFFWMYRFGHELSPRAPIDIPPFTPTIVGRGTIGNFHTLGLPGAGFYLLLAAQAAVALMIWLKRREKKTCRDQVGQVTVR